MIEHIIEGVKAQPIAMALVLINVLFLGASGYVLGEISKTTAAREERRDALFTQIAKSCFERTP